MRINLFLLGFIALLGSVADWLFPSVGVYIHAEAIAAAAAITAVAAIIGGIFSSASNNSAAKRTAAANLQATRETNEANYKMFQEANQFNLDLWNKENEYNTPAAQVQRLQEAGLNPYLMMSNGTTGSASSLTSADYKNAETPDLSALQNIQSPLGVVGQGVQSALQGLATGIQMKDAYNKAKISGSDAAFRDAMNAANVKYTLDNARLTSNQARGALADAIVSERTVGSRVQASKETSNLLYNQSRLASANADDAENRFVNNMRQNYYAWSTLSDIERMKEVVNGLDLDNKLKRKTLNWYDTLQQKGIDMINSNIRRNQSEITRNNHLNALTDEQKNLTKEQKLAQQFQNVIYGDEEVQKAAIKELVNKARDMGPQSFSELYWTMMNNPDMREVSGVENNAWNQWRAGFLGLIERCTGMGEHAVNRAVDAYVDENMRTKKPTQETVKEHTYKDKSGVHRTRVTKRR